jgi:hypothetical protein
MAGSNSATVTEASSGSRSSAAQAEPADQHAGLLAGHPGEAELCERRLRAVHAARHQRLAAGQDDQLTILPGERDQRPVRGVRFVQDLERLHPASIRAPALDNRRSRDQENLIC